MKRMWVPKTRGLRGAADEGNRLEDDFSEDSQDA